MKNLFIYVLIAMCHYQSFAIIIRHDIDSKLTLIKGNEHRAVLQMMLSDQLGTVQFEGTLIRDNWILTCAHFADAGIGPNQSLEILGMQYEIDSILIHPDYEGWDNDVALIRLKTSITNIRPLQLYDHGVNPGTLIQIVGTGSFGTGDKGIPTNDNIKRKATNKLTQVTAEWLFFQFDSPDSPEVTALEGVSGPGNSGGPALIEKNGKYYIVGISSHSETSGQNDGTYGVVDIFTNTTAAQTMDWIQQSIEAYDFLQVKENQFLSRLFSHISSGNDAQEKDIIQQLDKGLIKRLKKMRKDITGFSLETIMKNENRLNAIYSGTKMNFNYLLTIDLDSNFSVDNMKLVKQKIVSPPVENLHLPKNMTARTDLWKLPPTYVSLRMSDFLNMCLSKSTNAVSNFMDNYFESLPENEDEMTKFFSSISNSINVVKGLKIIEFKKNRGTIKFNTESDLWTLGVSINKTAPYKINGLTISR